MKIIIENNQNYISKVKWMHYINENLWVGDGNALNCHENNGITLKNDCGPKV